ncbi:MAG: sugar ABC transporter substrate-binding protein [Planctomycetes bacterium]|nr:sugar ABC transporter substrate-binding protein [Planctomycetota bacterium]
MRSPRASSRRQRIAVAAALVVAALGVPSGCSREPGGTGPHRPRIALVMKSLANEFFDTMEKGARAHQKAHEVEYELLADGIRDEQDVARQNDLVELMIAKKVDAIVLAPADSKALAPACKKAADAGIVVVNIDNKLDAAALAEKGLTVPFVGPNNRRGARLAGEHLAKRLKAGDEVAIVEGLPGAFNAIERRLGFEDAMAAAGMKVATSQTGKWEMGEANEVVGAFLPSHPGLKALLCSNDSMALGAAAALQAAGKLGQVLIVGYDNISAVQERIRKGEILCTVDQHADQIAVHGIEYALRILRERSAPADQETSVDLITAESLK